MSFIFSAPSIADGWPSRLLDNPKPSVVGIGWVVDCVEQRARVDETKYLVDIEGASIAGSNKRRRSMLPKHLLDLSESKVQTTPPEKAGQAERGTVDLGSSRKSTAPYCREAVLILLQQQLLQTAPSITLILPSTTPVPSTTFLP